MFLVNSIRTPDGTVLLSRHTHDFRGHTDANGSYYAVDGGNSYGRRIGPMDYTDLSVMDDGTLEKARQHLLWGTYGKIGEGGPPREFRLVLLKDMSNAHIEAILKDNAEGRQPLTGQYIRYFNKELEYRNDNNIVVEDQE